MTDISAVTISVIAIVATLDTILAQMTMAARAIYGFGRQGEPPAAFIRGPAAKIADAAQDALTGAAQRRKRGRRDARGRRRA